MRRLAAHRALLGALLIAGLILGTVAIDSGFISSRFREGGHTVHAEFANTGQLKKGDPVRVAGVVAGRVKGMHLADGGRSTIVDLTLFDSAGTLHRDATARIRWRTVLGGTFTVDVAPGSAAAPALGGATIPLSHTQSQIEIEDATAFDRGAARTGLRTTLKELPAALGDPAPVTGALSRLDAESPALAHTLGAFRGSHGTGLRRVVEATAHTLRAIDTPDDGVGRIVEGAATTLRTTAARQAELSRAFTIAGSIQPRVRGTLAALQKTLAAVDPLIARLDTAAPDVAPALHRLQPTVRSAGRLLATARPVAGDLQRAAHSLAATSKDGARLVERLDPSVGRLAHTILPGLAERDPVTGLRTYEIIGPTIASLDGAASTFDSEGHLFRFPALGGERTFANLTPCNVLLTDPEQSAMFKCEQVLGSLKRVLGHRPTIPRGRP